MDQCFEVFSGNGYRLDGELVQAATRRSEPSMPSNPQTIHRRPAAAGSIIDIHDLCDSVYEVDSDDAPIEERYVERYRLDCECIIERLTNCNTVLASYLGRLQEKQFNEGYLSHLEKTTLKLTEAISYAEDMKDSVADHSNRTYIMQDLEESCQDCEKNYSVLKRKIEEFLEMDAPEKDYAEKRPPPSSDADDESNDMFYANEWSITVRPNPKMKNKRMRKKTAMEETMQDSQLDVD